jgi:acyl-CoA thioesterase FadM
VYVWARLFSTVVRAHFAARRGPRQDPLAPVRTPTRVWPGDVDINNHLNNGRYLTLLDLGRYDWAIRSGIHKALAPEGWQPVVAAATVRFRRPLDLFDKIDLTTRIVFWDEKWFYIEHGIEKSGAVHMKALVRCTVLGPKGSVPMAEVLKALGEEERAVPPLPDAVRLWRELDQQFR